MNNVKITELRPALSIAQISTRKMGEIVAPPHDESVDLGWTWVDLGNGPEQIADGDIDVVARHIRLTVLHNPQDPAEDLKQMVRLRRDLWAHSPIEVDLDNAYCQTRRDKDRNAYFEFPTEFPNEVRRVLREYGYEGLATMEDLGEVGFVCARCGFLAGFESVCPKCQFRDIGRCPHCDHEIAREYYKPSTGDLFVCPDCWRRVRFQFNPDLFNADGSINEPVVIVNDAEG